ncbi:MAG: IS110 family transposase [Hyphomicrobiaceae bacterium]
MQAHTIGVDIANNVFQVHGVDADEEVVLTRQLRRKQVIPFFDKLAPCLIGMEACATSHYWARELTKLGHTVRLIPPVYVKAYVKRSKNDAADAAAICEAVTRPSMRFVPIKSEEQQAALAVHRARVLLLRQRTRLMNALRAHMVELGIVAETGLEGLAQLVNIVAEARSSQSLPCAMVQALSALIDQIMSLNRKTRELDLCIKEQHRASDVSKRLESIPGIGVISATALTATVTDPSQFKSGRDLAAWIGLVPKQNSTGGKIKLGSITKQGDQYLRRLLVIGGTSIVKMARIFPWRYPWVVKLLEKKPAKVVAVAVANKLARIAWAIMSKGGTFRTANYAVKM